MSSFRESASSNSGNSFNDIQHLEEDGDSISHQGNFMTINDEHSYPSKTSWSMAMFHYSSCSLMMLRRSTTKDSTKITGTQGTWWEHQITTTWEVSPFLIRTKILPKFMITWEGTTTSSRLGLMRWTRGTHSMITLSSINNASLCSKTTMKKNIMEDKRRNKTTISEAFRWSSWTLRLREHIPS